MAVYAELADGRVLEFPDGTPQEVVDKAVKKLIASETPPKEGIVPSLIGGTQRLGSTIFTGLESLIDPTGAAKRGVERGEEISQKYAPGADLEKVKEAYRQRGLLSAAGEVASQVPGAIAEQVPNIGATLGSARLGAMAGSAFGPIGTIVGGVGGAAVPSLMQLFGSNIERQAQEGADISRTKALAAAAPGAALETAATFVPLGRSIIGKILGPEAEKALARGTNEAIERAAKERLSATLAKGVGVGAAVEIPTEITQQMLERLQAGLPVTTPDALAEYGQAAYGAGLVGAPFGAVGRVGQRAIAKGKVEERAAEEAAIAAKAEENRRLAEQAGAPLLSAEQATLGGTLAGPVTALSEDPIIRAEQVRKIKEQQAQEAAVDKDELNDQNRVLAQEIERLEDQAAAAAKAGKSDVAIDTTLRLQEMRKAQNLLKTKAKDAGITLKSTKAAEIDTQSDLRKKLDAAKKELAKAGDLGDFDKIQKAGEKVKGLEEQIDESRGQMDLFGAPNIGRIEREEKVKQEEAETEQRRTLYNTAMLMLGKRAERAEAKQTQAEKEAAIAEEKAVRRLEFGIDKVGLSALGISGKERITAEEEVNKGAITSKVAKALGLSEIVENYNTLESKQKQLDKQLTNKKDKTEEEIAALELERNEVNAKLAQPVRSFEVLDNIEKAWQEASAKQKETTDAVFEGRLKLFDDLGNMTKEGREAVKNEVRLNNLTTLRKVGREAYADLEEERLLETISKQPTVSEARTQRGIVEQTKELESTKLRRDRANLQAKLDELDKQLADTEGKTEDELTTLRDERRLTSAALTRVSREFDAKYPEQTISVAETAVDKNQAFESFTDPIYRLQRGEFFGSRKTETDALQKQLKDLDDEIVKLAGQSPQRVKNLQAQRAKLASELESKEKVSAEEKARNKKLNDKIEKTELQLLQVRKLLQGVKLPPTGLKDVRTSSLEKRQSSLEGRLKTLSAGLTEQAGKGRTTFDALVKRAEDARDRYIQAAIVDINGARAGRNQPQLTTEEESNLRISLGNKFQEFIDRASSAQRIPEKETVGTFTDKEGKETDIKKTKSIPELKRPFAKVREALEVLREDLDTTIAEQRGDVKEAELPVETQKREEPARIIRGDSKIEKLADEIKSIDARLEKTPEPSQPVVESLKDNLKDLKRKATLLNTLLKVPKQDLDLYEDDPVLGVFIREPEALQKLYDDVRRIIPSYEKQLQGELAKAKERASLGEMKAKRRAEQEQAVREAKEKRGPSAEEILSKELDSAKQTISNVQRDAKSLENDIKKGKAEIKQLEKDLPKKLAEVKETRALAKKDRNPQLRLKKADRLAAEAEKMRQQIKQIKTGFKEKAKRIAELKKINKDLADFLRNNGIQTSFKEDGEAVLSRIEEAEEKIGLTPKQYSVLRKALNTRIQQTIDRLATLKPVRDVAAATQTGLGLPGVRVSTQYKEVAVMREKELVEGELKAKQDIYDVQIAKLDADIALAKEENEAAKAANKPVPHDLRLLNLERGRKIKLRDLVARYEFVSVPVRETTKIFATKRDTDSAAETQVRVLQRERKAQPKPPIDVAQEAVAEATKIFKEAEKELQAAKDTRDIKVAKAKVLSAKDGLIKAIMVKNRFEADIKKLMTLPKQTPKAVAKDMKLLDFDEMQDAEGLNEAISTYRKESDDIDWRVGGEQTDIVDTVEATKRLEQIQANAKKQNIKFDFYQSIADLPQNILEKLTAQGMDIYADKIRGGVLPDGTVFVVVNNHNNMVDLEKTIAHEFTGHYTFNGLLGPEGMRGLFNRVKKTFGTVDALAKKLGVTDEATAAYQQSMAYYDLDVQEGKKTLAEAKDLANIKALSEIVAYTMEKRVDASFLQKANMWLKELVGAFRAWARKMGLTMLADPSKITTSDLFYLMKQADTAFKEGRAVSYRTEDGSIALASGKPKAASGFDGFKGPDIIAKQQSFIDKVKANGLGLNFRVQFVDQRAAFEEAIKRAKIAKTPEGKPLVDDVVAGNALYFIRMADQRNNIVAQTVTKGTFSLVDLPGAKGDTQKALRSTGVSLKSVFEPLKEAGIGNEAFTTNALSKYLIAYRVLTGGRGADVVDIKGRVTDADLRRWFDEGNKIPQFVEVRKRYNEYNKGLINFLVQTGAISKELGAKLTKLENYVPLYRKMAGDEIGLIIGDEKPIRIGDLKNQPYLKELVGGEELIVDVFASSLRNTQLLTDMALKNLATRNAAFTLQQMGIANIHARKGPASPNVLRFKIDGDDRFAEVDPQKNEDVFDGIPVDLLVGGLEGIKVTVPFVIRAMAYPTNLLKKMITLDPRYAVRQVFRESLSSYGTSGADVKPLFSAMKNLVSVYREKNVTAEQLQRAGVLSGNVISGMPEEVSKRLSGIAYGKGKAGKVIEALENFAMAGETATKVSLYESFIRQGLSQRDAEFATMEAANMTRRGLSPSAYYANMLIPFFNAGIQGIDILYRAFTNQMPYAEKLKVQRKLLIRGALLAGTTMAYALMMEDDEAYKNAPPEQRYGNWFVRIPGVDEPFRIPIPFEFGLIFKAIPEGITNAMFTEEKGKDVAKDLAMQTLRSLPGNLTETGVPLPAGIKPIIELAANKSFFTGRDIVDGRMEGLDKQFQYRDKTPELLKAIGPLLQGVGLSPAQAEHLIRGYTASLGIGLLSVVSPIPGVTKEAGAVEKRVSDIPIVGGLFQPNDAGRVIDDAYESMKEINRRSQSFKQLVAEGRTEEAKEYLQENAPDIGLASFAGTFRQRMGDLTKVERAIKAAPETQMSPEKKREELDKIRKIKIDYSRQFKVVREQIERQAAR